MNRLRFIDHKGVPILLMDCSSNTKEEAYAIFEAFDLFIRAQADKSVLLLCDFENAYHDVTLLGKWKRASSQHERYVSRLAVLGVGGSFRIAMAGYRFFARLAGVDVHAIMRDFKDEESAKDWLIEKPS